MPLAQSYVQIGMNSDTIDPDLKPQLTIYGDDPARRVLAEAILIFKPVDGEPGFADIRLGEETSVSLKEKWQEETRRKS